MPDPVRLLPRPSTFDARPGRFALGAETTVGGDDAARPAVQALQAALRPSTGLPFDEAPTASASVRLTIDDSLAAEGFRLEVAPDGVRIAGGTVAGVRHATTALLQLLPAEVHRRARVHGVEWVLPACTVEDSPRWPWRGLLVDVARHFLPKHDLLRLIDLMQMHRLTVLHLHLTDDQGWRAEIEGFPRLTDVGGWRAASQVGAGDGAAFDGRPHGGWYTRLDLREIGAYAAERGIAVVPEIETPGHTRALTAAYPHLGLAGGPTEVWTAWGIDDSLTNLDEATVEAVGAIVASVAADLPGAVFGVGGDECRTASWERDPASGLRMDRLGLADGPAAQAWWLDRVAGIAAGLGRRPLVWDDVLNSGLPLPPGAIVAAWQGTATVARAAERGLDVVACPDDSVYFDYRQSDDPDEPIPVAYPITVADVLAFDPAAGVPQGARQHVLGGQANLWTEHLDSPRSLDYQLFPRLAALAEALWSGPAEPAEFAGRLAVHLERLDAIGVEYRHDDGPLPWQRRPGVAGRPEERAAWRS